MLWSSLSNLIVAVCALSAPLAVLAQQNPDVIVIGGGPSGIAAARKLTDAGRKVLILEGRNRMGGRVWSDKGLGFSVDLGASWIQGPQNNPMTDLASKYNITTIETDDAKAIAFDGPTGSIVPLSTCDAAYALIPAIDETRSSLASQLEGKDVPLSDVIKRTLESTGKTYTPQELACLSLVVTTTIRDEYAESTDKLSARYFDQGKRLGGKDRVFPNGYFEIFENLIKDLNYTTNTVVTKISYSDNGVTITTNNGTTFRAPQAIVTLPLGVLKSGNVTFEPALPSAKQDAIRGLGVGVLNKVFLQFPQGQAPVPPEQNFVLRIPAPPTSGQVPNESEMSLFLNVASYSPASNGIMGFISGAPAVTLESLPDTTIISQTLTLLKSAVPTLPDPIGFRISRWASDPFAFGSYSAPT
ncbi:hypothetical protein HK102_012055, partial [Quaeritorhiza haematococci]